MMPAKTDSVASALWESDALVWDRYWVPIFSIFARELVLVSSPSPGDVILDVGTGSGLAARELRKTMPSAGLITGIDSSEEMIRLARRRAASVGLRSVKFLKMNAEEQRFPNDFFDVVISNCGMSERGLLPLSHQEIDDRLEILDHSLSISHPLAKDIFLADLGNGKPDQQDSGEHQKRDIDDDFRPERKTQFLE